jgi:RimJ/RimL family protein N-acetyltransferase
MIKIEKITPGLIEGFHHTLDVVARERKYLAFLEAPPLDSTREFVFGNINNGNPQYVAKMEDRVVGWCDITRSNRTVHAHCGVLGMGLLPEFRGLGIGTKLINATMAAACDAGMTRIELHVHANNPAAIALYKKVGFKQEGILRDKTLIDGRYIDSIMMAVTERPA